ncbi:thioredoxin H5-like [Panicum miliaceum]|uniref:Thioredoxin H5-like n=1 Tax=Panicum miliaceum TaxID=4540 RepID=A0A3L6SVA0_PANMI|nr:thioredoxin H5-like [Panicum miliaceum]
MHSTANPIRQKLILAVQEQDGRSAVDDEEHLDYSAGKVTIIPDLKCWERKLDEANELGQTVVVKFSATWCGPCRNAAPLFAELSLKHSDLVFVSIDVDELPELVTQFDVRATPTFIFMRDKKEIDKLVGGNQEDLQRKFDPYCQEK